MKYTEMLKHAREVLAPKCRVCNICNGEACRGELPDCGVLADITPDKICF